jgi:hypothetical protein
MPAFPRTAENFCKNEPGQNAPLMFFASHVSISRATSTNPLAEGIGHVVTRVKRVVVQATDVAAVPEVAAEIEETT